MKKFDLIVAGGGLSGVAAAVGAARDGLSVLLVERSGCLGGAISNNAVYPFMPYYMRREDGTWRNLSAGIFGEMVERHKEMDGMAGGFWSSEIFKIMLDSMCLEANVTVLFHTLLVDVIKDGRKITGVKLAGKEGLFDISADFFIDATGDGDLFYLAGCDYQIGRESDGLCQPMTTCFRVSGVPLEKYENDLIDLQEKYKAKQEAGEITNPRENILYFDGLGDGIIHFNTTRVVKHNPVNTFELSKAEMMGRAQVLEMYRFFKENSDAFADSALVSIAQEIGVRESRKLLGVHVLTAQELIDQVDFEDSIAIGNYSIDIHNPEGSGTDFRSFKNGEYFRIPYRSLLPKEFDNLLVAGRCLSATQEAHSAVRIMPICACLGEAAGRAAAIAIKTGTTAHTLNVSALQAQLTANGAEIH